MSHDPDETAKSPVPTDRRALLAGLGGLAAGTFLSAGRAEAGPLNPLAAPASTGKTLTEVEPRIVINSTNTPADPTSIFKIVEPGSYYLTRNILGRSGLHGIVIASDNVSIDLMGFEIVGVAGALHGITDAFNPRRNVSIINGTIRDWPLSGVHLAATEVMHISDLSCNDNGALGIWCGGRAVLTRCVTAGSVNDGMAVGAYSVVTDCVASNSSSGGITTGVGCVVSHCSATQCEVGIKAGDGSQVVSCIGRANTVAGILAFANTLVVDCVASSNTVRGLDLGNYSKAERCSANGNGVGIETLAYVMVTGCNVSENNSHGILASTACVVEDNLCRRNGVTDAAAAGILTSGTDSRIEGNTSIENPEGIRATVAGNFIARNICSGNTLNWAIAAGNKCLVVSGVNAAAINGNSGGVSPGSTDPNANYTY
jgi:hypothetical protein